MKSENVSQKNTHGNLSTHHNLYLAKSWRSLAVRLEKIVLSIIISGELVIGTFSIAISPASAAPVSVNVCFKTGSELDLNSPSNANTKAKLTNAAYFGPSGTAAPETFIFHSLASVTSAALSSNNCQIYFGGGALTSAGDLTSTEMTDVSTWLQSSGHFLLAGCDYAFSTGIPGQICSSFRTMTNIANGGVSVNSLLSYNPLLCGGSLSVSTFGGASSYFTMLAGDTLLAKHNTAAQEPAAITDSLVNPKFLFTGDADMFGSSGSTSIGAGPTATSDQAKFIVNSFKFALDAIMGRLENPQCFTSYDQNTDLELSISTSNASPSVGGQTTLTMTVVNKGPNNVTGVTAIANLPSGLSLASQTGTGSYSTATQAWSIGALNNGSSASIILTLNVGSPGSFSIPAQITQSSLNDIDSSTNVGFGTDDISDAIADDDEAALTITAIFAANVLLVKRITAINGDRIKNPNDNTPLNTTVDDSLTSDNNDKWPDPKTNGISNFLQGAIDTGTVKPGDTIEYTIYFMNADVGNANSVRICDRITGSQSFLTDAYGTTGSGKDIQLHKGDGNFTNWSTTATSDLTGAIDIVDRARLVATASAPANCHLDMVTGGATDTGTLVVDVTGPLTANQPAWSLLSGSTGAGTTNSYGYIRFTTKVNP